MVIWYWVGGLTVFALLVYLAAALFKPEIFS